jgi:hypothetical protein
MTDDHTLTCMIVFSYDAGAMSIADDEIEMVYAAEPTGRYCNVLLCLSDGREITGQAHISAVMAVQTKLADATLPPAA